MSAPHFFILDSAGGQKLFDGATATGFSFSTNEHGAESLRATFPLSPIEATRVLDRIGTPHAVVSIDGELVWAGRVEDVAATNEGLALNAFGYWRALSDVPYTALWSDTSVARWKATVASFTKPEHYVIDTNNRLFIGLKKDGVYATSNDVGNMEYVTPSQSSRLIVSISFDYSVTLPTNWLARVYTSGIHWTLTGNGASQTGSFSGTFAGYGGVYFQCVNNTGSAYTNTAEEGANFAKLTNLRVKTTTAATVTADVIAYDVLASAPALQLSSALIQSPGVDLFEEIYEDEYPADILTRLAALGDNAGQRYEVGVDALQRLYLRPRDSASREWFIDAANIQLERSLGNMRNSVYGVYKNDTGDTLRTASADNAESIAVYGVTRRAALNVDTTSATQAELHRDVFVNDKSSLTARAGLSISTVYGYGGQPMPLALVHAGDYITIRNLPVSPVGATIDRVRRFRITRTEYDVVSGVMRIEPEQPLPELDFLIARQNVGIKQ